jgi:hypothetical protein
MGRTNEIGGGVKMKQQQAYSVDIRIKEFMKHKMAEFPELKEKYGPRVEVVQRGYLWEDIIGFFAKKVRVS